MRKKSAAAVSKTSFHATSYPVASMTPPTVDKLATYFKSLGRGEILQNIDFFKRNVELIGQKNQSPVSIMEHFWYASRAASRSPNLNKAASTRTTKDANQYLAGQVHKLEAIMEDKSVNIQSLERLLNTYTRLQTVPSASMIEKLKDETSKKMIGATADCLSSLLYQFVQVGVYPGDEWMDKWWEVTGPRSGAWGMEGGFSVFYNLAQMDLLRSQDPDVDQTKPSPCAKISKMFERFLVTRDIGIVFPKEVDSHVFFAAKWFGYDCIKGCDIEKEHSKASRSENAFAKLFNDTQISAKSNGIIVPEIGHHIDLKLDYNDHMFGVEYDGTLHFLREKPQPSDDVALKFNTSTRLQSWLISKLCPELHVLRVPYFQCYQDDRRQPWEDTFDTLSSEEPGVYAYHGDGIVKNMADPENNIFKGHDL